MTDQTHIANPLISAVEQAAAAVLQATTPDQYRQAQRALIAAGVALRDKVWQRHQWLVRNWDRLAEYELTLPPAEFEAKEDIWMTKCAEYEVMFACLAEALTIVALAVPNSVEEKSEQGVLL